MARVSLRTYAPVPMSKQESRFTLSHRVLHRIPTSNLSFRCQCHGMTANIRHPEEHSPLVYRHALSLIAIQLQLTSSTGNPLSEYAKITDQPILSIVNTTTGRQHWTVMIDSIILNNGTLKMKYVLMTIPACVRSHSHSQQSSCRA